MRNSKILPVIFVVAMFFLSTSLVNAEQIPVIPQEKSEMDHLNFFIKNQMVANVLNFFQPILSQIKNFIPYIILSLINFRDIFEQTDIEPINENIKSENDRKIVRIEPNQLNVDVKKTNEINIESFEKDTTEQKNDNIDNKNEKKSDQNDVGEKYDIELSLSLDEIYDYGKPIQITATLTNIGEEMVVLCEMDMMLRSLDFEIETPLGYQIHYLGPFEGKPEPVKLLPFNSIITKVNITSSNYTFGEMNPTSGGIAGPFVFIPGKYTIRGVYISHQTITVDSANYWQGVKLSPDYDFTVKSMITTN